MAKAGTVTVDFAAETAKFTAELKKVNTSLKSLQSGFSTIANVAKNALAIFSAGAFVSFIKQSADAADALGKTSDKLGVAAEKLKAYQVAAVDAGISTEQANKLLSDSQKRLGEAAQGTGKTAEVIKQLGLNVRELQQLSPDQLFVRYSEALGTLSNRSDQFAAANALFGKSASEAFNFIATGAEALEQSTQFVDRFGLALSRVELKQIENAGDAIDRLKFVSEAAGQRIAVGLSPLIEFLSDRMLEATGNTKDLQTTVESFSEAAIGAFEIVANAVRTAQAAFFGIAAGGARVLQFLTFGDVSESFAASVDENLRKADDALQKIKSIEEIQQTIATALESSRARAEEAVAAQAASDAARQASGTTLGGIEGLTFQDTADIANEAARAAAEEQKRIARELSQSLLAEFRTRAEGANRLAQYEVDLARRKADEENAARLAVVNTALDTFALLATGSKKGAKIQKAVALAEAIRNTYVGITAALRGDPYTAIPRAIAIGAFGFAQVRAILATPDTGGGGSFTPAGGGFNSFSNTAPGASGQTGNPQPVGATSQPVIQLIVNGNLFNNRGTAETLMEEMRRLIDENEFQIMSPNSGNARAIRKGVT